jgi:hypothetical protein
MNDIIFIANTTYGPAIWLPVVGWIPVNSPIVGSFLAIVVSVVIAIITIMRTSDSNRRYIETVREESERHIAAMERASANQIDDARYWRDTKRIQLLKLLIQELEENVNLCDHLVKKTEQKDYYKLTFSFFLVAIEKCLADTPIDDSTINKKLLIIYYIMKTHDNAVKVTRIPGISAESLEEIFQKITWDHKQNQKDINETIELIRSYEQELEARLESYHINDKPITVSA